MTQQEREYRFVESFRRLHVHHVRGIREHDLLRSPHLVHDLIDDLVDARQVESAVNGLANYDNPIFNAGRLYWTGHLALALAQKGDTAAASARFRESETFLIKSGEAELLTRCRALLSRVQGRIVGPTR